MKATEVLDKILVAKEPVIIHEEYPGSEKMVTVNKDEEVGRVFSWVQEPDGLYWQLYTVNNNENDRFVKHDRFKLKIRRGAINPGNLIQEFAESLGFEGGGDFFGSLSRFAILIAVVAGLYFVSKIFD